MLKTLKLLSVFLLLSIFVGCSSDKKETEIEQTESNLLSSEWPGKAISYSGYRNGQDPRAKLYPTQEEVYEDLLILEKNWNIIRIYGADKHSADVLEVISKNNIKLKVMMGIWLDGEPEYTEDNADQIKQGIELTNKFKDIVIAVNVGNETQYPQSDHKVPNGKLVSYIKEVQSKVDVPVTTADTWYYWMDIDKSKELIEAVDFIAAHIYPIWGMVDIDSAMIVTQNDYERLSSLVPNKKIMITEAGWGSYTDNEKQVPKAGDEVKQTQYYNDLMKWSEENKVIVFWFEAFDEPWKGNGKTEGHWGLFTESRNAKQAMYKLYPELVTNKPTSPIYK